MLDRLFPAEEVSRILSGADGSVWEAAIATGRVTDDDLTAAAATTVGVPVAREMDPTRGSLAAVGERLARRYGILPLAISDSTVEIATANPFDMDCESTIAFACGRSVRMKLASPRRIRQRLDEVYAAPPPLSSLPAFASPVDAAGTLESVRDAPDEELDSSAGNERPVIRLVDHIVSRGIEARASDIHFEPGETGVSVRYRVDGLLREGMCLPRSVGLPLVSRIKIMAELDIADRLRPQGGRARVSLNGSRIDLRVSTLPAAHGEKVVIRILDPRSSLHSFDALGLDPVDGPRLQRLLDVREGLVLVTGPTGSGKTTTLYAALKRLLDRGVNIITVEDPVEYRIPGIVQVQINEKAGLTFASALRSILRQDPDVVLVGEIRDRETAAIAIQASLTGHLVLATLHTNDACSSITRLADLGVDTAKLAAAVKGVVAQRLVRRLCPSCRIVAPGGVPGRLRDIVPPDAMVHIPIGCDECGMTGYQGRLAITEIVMTTPDLEREISLGSATDRLAAVAHDDGARSLWASGVAHALEGETSIDELLRVVEPPSNRKVTLAPGRIPPSASRVSEGESAGGWDQFDPLADFLPPLPPMTQVVPGVVDVYLLRPAPSGFEVLVLRRAERTRCTGAWETVHGRLEDDERPEDGAVREVREETGIEVARLYNVTVQPFFLHTLQTVQLAIVFAAFVKPDTGFTLGPEHDRAEWLPVDEAIQRFAWPREREALAQVVQLLGSGDAGAVEDVLRVF